MGKNKKLPKRFFDEKGKEYVIDESEDEIVLKKTKGKKHERSKKRKEESSDSSSSSSSSESESDSSSNSSSEDEREKSKRSKSKGKEKKSLSEETSLSKKNSKDLDELSQLKNWLKVNEKKIAQAKSFLKKSKKIGAKVTQLQFSKLERANKLMNDASRRKNLLTTLEEMKVQNEDGSLKENAAKIQQLRKGVTKIRKNGEAAFEEAMQLIKKLSSEEKEKLFTDPKYQARNKDAKSFDELISKVEADSNEAFEQLKKSMIKVGIDPSIQSNVLQELQATQKKRKRTSPEKQNMSMEITGNEVKQTTEAVSSEEPPRENPVESTESSAVGPDPVPQIAQGPESPPENNTVSEGTDL